MIDRKQTSDAVLAMRRAGKKTKKIAEAVGITERRVIKLLDGLRQNGVDTSPVKQEAML